MAKARRPLGGTRAPRGIDLEALERELVGVVNDTMQPVHASLWLREAKP